MCALCRKNPFEGLSASTFATPQEAEGAARLHRQRHHGRVKDVLLSIIEIRPGTKLPRPPVEGPYVGMCQVCEGPVTDTVTDFNVADDLAEQHRWQRHAGQEHVIVGVAAARNR